MTYAGKGLKNWPSWTDFNPEIQSWHISGASLKPGYGVKAVNTIRGVTAAGTGYALLGVIGRAPSQNPDTVITQYTWHPVIPMQDGIIVPVTIEGFSGAEGYAFKGQSMALSTNSNGTFRVLNLTDMMQTNITGFEIVGKLHNNYIANDETIVEMEMGK